MKKLLLALSALATLVIGTTLAVTQPTAATNQESRDIVGVWEVDADAPYRPHLFTFHADGTMTTTNPTNVQENPTAPHSGTNDSLGMGVWKTVKDRGNTVIVGTFEQLNALADTHQPTDKLSVSFRIQLSQNGQHFEGPASAKVGTDVFPSHLSAQRVELDQTAIDAL